MLVDDQTLATIAHDLFLVVAYGFLGGGIKYIDQAFDIGVFNKKVAVGLAVPTGLLMGGLMVYNASSATIFLAVVLAVALTQKVDNIAFRLGAVLLILVPVVFRNLFSIIWLPFGLLVFSGLVDEYGNDWADRRIRNRFLLEANGRRPYRGVLQGIFEFFFLRRFAMKVMLFLLCLTGYFRWIYLIAFLSFDLWYTIIEKISLLKKQSKYRISQIMPQKEAKEIV